MSDIPKIGDGKKWTLLADPAHMEWKSFHDALHARVMLEDMGDENLCASREEVCALLSWARSFDKAAQPRRDEEERAYAVIRRAADHITAAAQPTPEVERLREALEPFALLAPSPHAEAVKMSDPLSRWFTVADFSDAAAALAHPPANGDA